MRQRTPAARPKVIWLGGALVLLSGCLTALGIWLDREFDASRGPLRGVNPDVIVTLSLILVGLVVVLWGLAWYRSVRASDGNRR